VNYLEALKTTKELTAGRTLNLNFGFSGSAHALITYLEAAALKSGYKLCCKTPKIGQFHQFLINKQEDPDLISILFPWDLASELDWRSGIPTHPTELKKVIGKAERFFSKFPVVINRRSFYVNASIPPIFHSSSENQSVRSSLVSIASDFGLNILDDQIFDLNSYLRSGCPFASSQLWTIARRLCDTALSTDNIKKVLVTDCDNVLWAGVIAEDMSQGIHANPNGVGYGHFIYQTYLKHLLKSGILIAAITRNHLDDINVAMSKPEMLMKESDFIAIMASYRAKSSQISALSESLNLGLEGFVFVDDNPVEIAEVTNNLPQVTTLQYPEYENDLPALLSTLARLFSRDYLTNEDSLRTKSYRTNLNIITSDRVKPGRIDNFLKDLNMTLTIKEIGIENLERPVQLLNKTNQFTCNGKRVTANLISNRLNKDARLISATLTDNGGNHGEILCILIDSFGVICYFSMSCRVFERYVERVFLHWLLNTIKPITSIDYRPTERNEPFQLFLEQLAIEGNFKLSSNSRSTLLPQETLASISFLADKQKFINIETTILA